MIRPISRIFEPPHASALYLASSIPLLLVAVLALGIPIQEARLLHQPLFAAEDRTLWIMGSVHLVLGAGALAMAWGSWTRRSWALTPTARQVLVAIVTAGIFVWIRQLFG